MKNKIFIIVILGVFCSLGCSTTKQPDPNHRTWQEKIQTWDTWLKENAW